MTPDQTPQPEINVEAARRAQNSRNRWLALALVGFVVIVGLTTAMRLRETLKDECNRFYMTGSMKDSEEERKCREQKANSIPLDASGEPVNE